MDSESCDNALGRSGCTDLARSDAQTQTTNLVHRHTSTGPLSKDAVGQRLSPLIEPAWDKMSFDEKPAGTPAEQPAALPEQLDEPVVWLSAAQASTVAAHPGLAALELALPCWAPQRLVGRALGHGPGGVDLDNLDVKRWRHRRGRSGRRWHKRGRRR